MLNLGSSDPRHGASLNLPPETTCFPSRCMTLEGPLGPLKRETMLGSFWTGSERPVQERPCAAEARTCALLTDEAMRLLCAAPIIPAASEVG